jgi:hypothetical protein
MSAYNPPSPKPDQYGRSLPSNSNTEHSKKFPKSMKSMDPLNPMNPKNPMNHMNPMNPLKAPYYMPPYYPIPSIAKGPPMGLVDQQLPGVPFKLRPMAMKIAIGILIIGVVFCIFGSLITLTGARYNFLIQTVFIYFVSLTILGIISITLLIIPKKLGWYLAFITGIAALPGFGIGTLIAIFLIISLFWPSIRYYFHTGQYPPNLPSSMIGPAPYGMQPYPTDHIPISFKPREDNERK